MLEADQFFLREVTEITLESTKTQRARYFVRVKCRFRGYDLEVVDLPSSFLNEKQFNTRERAGTTGNK